MPFGSEMLAAFEDAGSTPFVNNQILSDPGLEDPTLGFLGDLCVLGG